MKVFKRILSTINNNRRCFLLVLVTLASLTFGVFQYLEKDYIEFQYKLLKSTPPITLGFSMEQKSSNTVVTRNDGSKFIVDNPIFKGQVSGLVHFTDKLQQPKNFRQFYIIKAADSFDSNYNQLFSIQEVFDYDNLSPYYFDSFELPAKNIVDGSIVLEDSVGNQFFINTQTKQVRMYDATGDITDLITDEREYKEFINDFGS